MGSTVPPGPTSLDLSRPPASWDQTMPEDLFTHPVRGPKKGERGPSPQETQASRIDRGPLFAYREFLRVPKPNLGGGGRGGQLNV